MSVHIYFSNNSIRNTTLSCDSLGVHYTVSKTGRIISLARWNSKENMNVKVGEFELPFFRSDQIRVGPNGQWQPMRDFLHRDGGCFSHPMSFAANNGMLYTWKSRWGKLLMTHQSAAEPEALITYHRNVSSPSYLEISDPSVMNGLGNIILAFLIVERKRRNRQKKRRYNSGGGGGP